MNTITTLAKPLGAGDTKKVRRIRKKMEGKAAAGSISTIALLRQCREVGAHVKPLLTLHLERHGHEPTLAAKEARQLVLHCATGSSPPRAAEIRNLPAVRAVLIVALTGAAAAAAPPAAVGDAASKDEGSDHVTVPSAASSPLDGFTEDFKRKFRLCAGLKISSGGHSAMLGGGASDGTGTDGGWLKSLADALLYAPLGEDREACPAGPFSGKKRKDGGGSGGRKKKTKGDAKRRRKELEKQNARCGGNGSPEELSGADGARGDSGTGVTDDEDDHTGTEKGHSSDAGNGKGEEDADAFSENGTTEQTGDDDEPDEEVSHGGEDGDDEEGEDLSPLPAIESYILTVTQLRENGFPVPSPAKDGMILEAPDRSKTCSPSLGRVDGEIVLPSDEEAESLIKSMAWLPDLEGHVQTQLFLDTGDEAGGAKSRMFGLDCEMCITEAGQELTRVTLVDAKHEVLLDEFVKPDNPIVDYVTRYSGVTPQLLENIDTKLHHVQAAMLRVVGSNDVLVGHSLENDLKALKMVHLRCLDTSLLYPHPKKGRRSSLRFLVSMYLQRRIQDSEAGHNSAEDAIAALELAQLKISKGPNFGAERSTDSVFDRLHRNRVPATMVASSEQCRRHVTGAASAIPSLSDDWVVQRVLKELREVSEETKTGTKPPLLWAELEGPKSPTVQEVCNAAAGGSSGINAFLAGMDDAGRSAGHERRISRLLDELPEGVVVFVTCQGVNPELPRKLDKQRKACEDRRCASMWSVGQGKLLAALESRARDGCIFVAVT